MIKYILSKQSESMNMYIPGFNAILLAGNFLTFTRVINYNGRFGIIEGSHDDHDHDHG